MGGVRGLRSLVNAVVSDYFHLTEVSDCFSKWEGSEAVYLSENQSLNSVDLSVPGMETPSPIFNTKVVDCLISNEARHRFSA